MDDDGNIVDGQGNIIIPSPNTPYQSNTGDAVKDTAANAIAAALGATQTAGLPASNFVSPAYQAALQAANAPLLRLVQAAANDPQFVTKMSALDSILSTLGTTIARVLGTAVSLGTFTPSLNDNEAALLDRARSAGITLDNNVFPSTPTAPTTPTTPVGPVAPIDGGVVDIVAPRPVTPVTPIDPLPEFPPGTFETAAAAAPGLAFPDLRVPAWGRTVPPACGSRHSRTG
jgi:hypothetical protein